MFVTVCPCVVKVVGGGWYQKCDLGPQKPCRFKYYRLINAFDTNSTLIEK